MGRATPTIFQLSNLLQRSSRRNSLISDTVLDQLRQNHIFVSLDDDVLEEIASEIKIQEYKDGDVIIQQGSKGLSKDNYYYILAQGKCAVFKNGKKLAGKYGILQAGTSFGESALFTSNSKREASIVALDGDVILYALDGTFFRSKFDEKKLKNLQLQIKNVYRVYDVLSGVDTKIGNLGTIIRPWRPDSLWLLTRFKGTILQYVKKPVLVMMAISAMVSMGLELWVTGGLGNGFDYDIIEEQGGLLNHLGLLATWWNKLQPLVTFVSTFFLAEAFGHWKKFYWTTRGIQGRFNDISLLVASSAARDECGDITPEATTAIKDIQRMAMLLHTLYWASVVTRYKALTSPEGLSYIRSFRQITQEEYESLKGASDEGLALNHAVMTWLTARLNIALERGEIKMDRMTIYEKMTTMRTLMARIPDMYDGRMPIAYVHFVHMLVTTLLVISPISLFPMLYYWSIPAVGVLTLFYKGIMELSLMFLDPVDNDQKHFAMSESAGFDVGVLIREGNASSVRYEECARKLPRNFLRGLPTESVPQEPRKQAMPTLFEE